MKLILIEETLVLPSNQYGITTSFERMWKGVSDTFVNFYTGII